MEKVEGIFGVIKPVGISSQRAVTIVKRWARAMTGDKKIRVGHGGTLDLLAEGILVIAVGRIFTRQLEDAVAAEKEYVTDVMLGATSETDDDEGVKTHVSDRKPTEEEILAVIPQFVGDITQETPTYSAVNVGGERAYKKARRGEKFSLGFRSVHVESIEVLSYAYPIVQLKITCGGGTYIRSIARDIGAALEVGAYITRLDRTRVGSFVYDDAKSLDDFALVEKK